MLQNVVLKSILKGLSLLKQLTYSNSTGSVLRYRLCRCEDESMGKSFSGIGCTESAKWEAGENVASLIEGMK